MTVRLLEMALVATAASAAIAALIVLSQRWHGKHTLDHDLVGVQKFHTTAVPRIGGLAIVVAILLTLLFFSSFAPDPVFARHLRRAGLLLLASVPVFGAGMLEDVTKRVSVKIRLAASVMSALLASWLLGAIVDELNLWLVDSLLGWAPFALVVTAITVAGGINAINIIDGFNGLASSIVAVMLAALGVIAYQVGDLFVAELAGLGLGAALGFLLVNYPTGRLFLGDGGAYFLGFWVAEIVVLLLVRDAAVNAWCLLSVCAHPIIEVGFTIYRRKFVRKTSPGAPDGLHLHTLVYRRVVSRLFEANASQPWKRNAAVACVIVPWVAVAAIMSALVARSVTGSIVVVLIQFVSYVAVYNRLVRGRWAPRSSAALLRTKTQMSKPPEAV